MSRQQDREVNAFYDRLDGITDRFAQVMHRRLRASNSGREQARLLEGWRKLIQVQGRYDLPTWWNQELHG